MNKGYLKFLFFSVFGKLIKHRGEGNYRFYGLDSPTPLLSPQEYVFDPISDMEGPKRNDADSVIYVCSPTQRSGTNYLANVLRLSNEIYIPEGEDLPSEHFFVSYGSDLSRYIKKTLSYWGKWVKDPLTITGYHSKLLSLFGDGIVRFFVQDAVDGKRLLLRTPDAGGLEFFFHLFPAGHIVCIVRDGRDTVDSFLRSFSGDWAFRKFCKRWASRIDYVYDLKETLDQRGLGERLILVSYEEINIDPEEPVKNLLESLHLSNEKYQWDKLSKIPVLGSSTQYKDKSGQGDFWKPGEKVDASKFSQKWLNWSPRKKRIFKSLAGAQLIRAGYEVNQDW